MSDTIDSSLANLSLSAQEEEPPRRSRLSQTGSSRLSQTSQRSSANSRPRTSLDRFFEDPDSPKQPPTNQQSGVLYNRGDSNNRDAAREESRKVESMENEIFNLKLKITLLEKNSKLSADSKELYQQLTSTHAARRTLEAENAQLKEKMRHLSSGSEDVQFKLAEQEEMLNTFLDAQDEYSRICDGVITAFNEPDLAEYMNPIEGPEIDGSQLDGKLSIIRNIVVNLLSALKDAQDNYSQVEAAIGEYLADKEGTTTELDSLKSVLRELCDLFEGVAPTVLSDHVLDLIANNEALETQLQEHVNHEQSLELKVEELAAKVPIDAHAENSDLRRENAKLMDAISRASARSYDITRQFFRRLTAYMGPEWGEENDKRLRQIIEESRSQNKSKLPLLVELMMQCVDEMAMMARGAEVLPGENAELEEKVRYLEDLLTQELTRMGADKVLIAKYRDLEERLKIETEKRKNEYIGYQRSLTNLSLQ